MFGLWMVKSNLERIHEGKLKPEEVVALLRHNGYVRIAKVVEDITMTNMRQVVFRLDFYHGMWQILCDCYAIRDKQRYDLADHWTLTPPVCPPNNFYRYHFPKE